MRKKKDELEQQERQEIQDSPKQKRERPDRKQRRLNKKTRGGVELTENQVRAIKQGRKELRKQMKKQKIRSRKEFELTASSMGLYFDKQRAAGLLLWLFHGRALAALLGALVALLFTIFMFSVVTQMKGHFTINLSDEMFKEGFVLSEDREFTNPTSQLFSLPLENVPCISISSIPDDVDEYDGSHNGIAYFAYSFYIRNEGDKEVNYMYEVAINSESQDLSSAAWVMLFVDGDMTFYAQKSDDGGVEALPAYSETRRGYREAPLIKHAADPEKQYEVITSSGGYDYYRVLPKNFETESIIATGQHKEVQTGEIHKYTVVMWLEGDDPDCVDDLIGGHLGLEMGFRLLDGNDEAMNQGTDDDFWYSIKELGNSIWDSLIFWED